MASQLYCLRNMCVARYCLCSASPALWVRDSGFSSQMELDPENPDYRQLLADGSADIPDRVIMDALQSAERTVSKMTS